VRLAAAPELVSQLGEAGRRRHQAHFTVEQMVGAYLGLFERLAAARAESGGMTPAPEERRLP
jgi:hypothetical protein